MHHTKVLNPKTYLFLILILSFLVRFWGLGYSHFYGDETKTFYLDKTIPASQFFLDQRKGPVQFLAVWLMEKLSGGYDELFTRLPFAFAGFVSVYVFYLIVDKLFNKRVTLISTTLFSFNGFFIAFSRTIQYQSFLILFGLLSVYFALQFVQSEHSNSKYYALLSGLFLGLSYLSHYDAVFFDLVVGYLIIRKLIKDPKALKDIAFYLVIPCILVVSLFYVPYFLSGYYESNTVSYLGRRVIGSEFSPNASWYTFWVYNPTKNILILSFFSLMYFFKKSKWKRHLVFLWFFAPFFTFQFIFSRPGTHIQNYVLPLCILIALGINDLYKKISTNSIKVMYSFFVSVLIFMVITVSFIIYVPNINPGYPWKSGSVLGLKFPRIDKSFHLYLYGFPYNRGWDQISSYVAERGGVRGVYTNDNDTIAEYYLRGISYTKPGSNFLPDFYVHVEDNQQFVDEDQKFSEEYKLYYELEKEFFVDGVVVSRFYRKVAGPGT